MSQRHPPDMRLVSFVVEHASIGVMVALALVYAIVKFDAFGIGTLTERAADGWLALLLLFVGLAVTLGSVAVGTAVFMLPKDEDRWR
ncbi:MAG: hypothetical protein AAFX81_20825 [Pseudomonadota bacterium]